jgi:hypothetical protein
MSGNLPPGEAMQPDPGVSRPRSIRRQDRLHVPFHDPRVAQVASNHPFQGFLAASSSRCVE